MVDKSLCMCYACGTEVIGMVPGSPCPGCNKPIQKHWAEHVAIEDDYSDGYHMVVSRYSKHPLKGRYCSLHQIRE